MSLDVYGQSESPLIPEDLIVDEFHRNTESTRSNSDRALYDRVKMLKPIDAYYAHGEGGAEDKEKRKADYKKLVRDNQELYGFLSYENPLYNKLRGVLDQVLRATHIDPKSVKFDCILNSGSNAFVVPEGDHIFLHLGTLSKARKDKSISLDVVAGLLAHEIVHIKYKNKPAPHSSEFGEKIRNYTLRREEERVADIEAVEILNRSGFNPNAMTTLFESFAELEKTDDEDDFAMSGIDGILYDPHESGQRRVDYLKEHIGNHLFKNRDKQHDVIGKEDIDLKNETFGFLFLLNAGKTSEAIQAIKQPWQLAYVCSYLIRESTLFSFESQLNALKSTVWVPALPDFTQAEQEFLWEIMTRDGDYNANECAAISSNKDINLEKIVLYLPTIFPDTRMKYHHPLDPSLDVGDPDFYSPLEKVMSLVKGISPVKISTAFFKRWAKDKPEWVENFIDVTGQQITKSALDRPDEVMLDLLDALLKSKIYLSNSQKQAIFRLFNDQPAAVVSQFIEKSKSEAMLKKLCKRNLITENPDRNHRSYIEDKYDFLKLLKEHADDEFDFLSISNGIDTHKRLSLIGISPDSKFTPENENDQPTLSFYTAEGDYIKVSIDPEPFPWQIVDEHQDEGDVEESDEEESLDGLKELISDGTYRITPHQLWSVIIIRLFKSDEISKDNLKRLLSTDVDPDLLANIICYQLTDDKRFSCMGHLDKLAKNNPKARRIRNLVNLAMNQYSEVHKLPRIFERNYLILNEVKASSNKLEIYLRVKKHFIQEDKKALHKRLDEEFADGTLHRKIVDILMTKSAGSIYQQSLLGPANHAMDEAAFLAWQELKASDDFIGLNLSERIDFIKNFFPAISFRREEILTDLEVCSEDELHIILESLTLPVFRYQIGDRLWDLKLNDYSGSTLDEKLKKLCECFPEASYYRDDIIERLLLDNACTYEEIEEYKTVLYAGNTLRNTADEQMGHLFVFRLLSQILYFSHEELKSNAFEKLLKSAEKDAVFRKYFTHAEKLALLKVFFTGPECINQNPTFRQLLENMFLEKVFSPDMSEKLSKLAMVDSNIKRALSEIDQEYEDNPNLEYDESGMFEDTELNHDYRREIEAMSLDQLSYEEFRNRHDQDKFIMRQRRYSKLLKETIPQEVFTDFPMAQKLFFAIVDTLPQERQAHVISQFLINTLDGNEKTFNDLVVAFLEHMGPVWIKAGQFLASLGYFDREMQLKLLKLTSRVEPISVFQMWHVLWEEFGDDFDFIETIGPLLGVASIRQVHKAKLRNGEERIVKVKRPEAIHTIKDGLTSLRKFVDSTKKDSRLLGGVVLPDDIVDELIKVIDNEVLSSGDQVEQNHFHEKYKGVEIAGKALYIPTVDQKHSTNLVTIETEAPGLPLSEKMETLTDETKESLLTFFLQLMFEEGKYHADPHPGNILESANAISLVDFGMVAELNPKNRYLFFDIIQKVLVDSQKALNTLLVGHLHNGGSLESLDLGVVKQEVNFLFETSSASDDTFQDTALRLLNTLENLKISLPSEIKILIKTISQMGYLIKGREAILKHWFADKIFANAMSTQSKDFERLHEQVNRFITENDEADDLGIVKIAEGSLVRETAHTEIVKKTVGNVELDPAKIGDFLMLDLEDSKVGILPGKRNYEVFRAGRWVSVEELVFGE